MAPLSEEERSSLAGPRALTLAISQSQAQEISPTIAQANNQKAAQYFAIAMSGFIILFSALHWSRKMYNRHRGLGNANIVKVSTTLLRRIRRALSKGLPGFISYGHLIVVLTYLGINIALTITNVDRSGLFDIARRCGWMAICNVAFITLLALKNTPLAMLTSYSYERLNSLHRVGGYTTITYAFLHAALMCTGFYQKQEIQIILEHNQINGMIAVSSLLVMLITATFIRKIQYEVFYLTHIIMYMLLVINIGMHRPNYALKVVIITTFAGCIWTLDRILRACRILLNLHNNWATVTALPYGGTRVVLCRPPPGAVPGAHCFLWIPQIRWIETHPFTIVSVSPQSLEFVVAAHDGFTKDLHLHAQLRPGARIRASIDGPYGTLPVFAQHADKVVLVAGGSGASFTFGVALDMTRKLRGSNKTVIDFVWTVKEYESLSWFSKELAMLQTSPLVNLHLYTTNMRLITSGVNISGPVPTLKHLISSDDQKPCRPKRLSPTSTEKSGFSIDITKARTPVNSPTSTESVEERSSWDPTTIPTTTYGKPDVASLIKHVVTKADDSERIVIATCGPPGLMKAVRSATADAIQAKGPRVELHCEAFGW